MGSFPKGEVWRSLKTGDLSIENSIYPKALVEIEEQFSQARIDAQVCAPKSLDSVDIAWITKPWFHANEARLMANDIGFENSLETAARIQDIQFERALWLEEPPKANAAELQAIADKALIEAGGF